MPPLRSVSNCSPSASARTVTAHSLKAIGMRKKGGDGGFLIQKSRAQRQRGTRPILCKFHRNAKSPCKFSGLSGGAGGLKLHACSQSGVGSGRGWDKSASGG